MCGFVGYLLSEDVESPDLMLWSDRIRHRGPDQAGRAQDGGFGIGTRRLSILDLSEAGSQPMHTERFILGFNGEIYNHLDLRAELERDGCNGFVSHSDTETILRAFDHWGIHETLERLNGMYALALWDKHSQQLTLARDPMGIKPIYIVRDGDVVYFASELKALRPFTPGRVSRDGLALYLYFGFVPAPYSLMEGVYKVRPGEAIVLDRSGSTSRQIVPRDWVEAQPIGRDPDQREQEVRQHVEAAIERQLISDVPVGVFLSGGVDSTIIATVAAARQPNLTSFSLRPHAINADVGSQRDAEIAARVAGGLGLRHIDVPFHPDDVVGEVESFLSQIDEPVAELYAMAEVILSKQARQEGVKVILTGHGGDEVFLGYPTYDAVFRGDLYNMIPLFGPALRLASRVPGMSAAQRTNLLGAASIWRKPPMERYGIISGVHFSLHDVSRITGMQPERLAGLVQGVVAETHALTRQLPRAGQLRNAELFARMDMLLMVPEHYNTRLDRTTMCASIEARVPLQDLKLVGYISQLPHEELMRGGLKGLLRNAFADILPDEILNRPKQTFQAPMASWISGAFAPWIAEQTARSPLPQTDAARGARPAAQQAYRAWSLALFEGWRRSMALDIP